MEEKKYFYLLGNETIGPFSVNEIIAKRLPRETLLTKSLSFKTKREKNDTATRREKDNDRIN